MRLIRVDCLVVFYLSFAAVLQTATRRGIEFGRRGLSLLRDATRRKDESQRASAGDEQDADVAPDKAKKKADDDRSFLVDARDFDMNRATKTIVAVSCCCSCCSRCCGRLR